MRRTLLVPAFCVLVAVGPAAAQQTRRLPTMRQFPTVNVQRPAAVADAGFTALRATLAAIARRRSFVDLAGIVMGQGFFWTHGTTELADAKRSGPQILAAALRLDEPSSVGWQRLADFAAEPGATPSSVSAAALCAPGKPKYVPGDFQELLEVTHTSAADWVYPRMPGVTLRAARRDDAQAVETLGNYLVRVLRFVTVAANAAPLQTSWTRVAAPSGKIGYAPPESLESLSAAQLCYAKDAAGKWLIAGFIAEGS